jgi:Fe-S oxidoreductase
MAPVTNRLLTNSLARRLGQLLLGLDRRRPLPPFARPTFRRGLLTQLPTVRHAGVSPSAERSKIQRVRPTVAYFCDLFADYNDPELAAAVVRILHAHGVSVIVPDQRSSAVPEMLYGYASRVRQIAQYNVDAALSQVDQGALVVSAEPTATFALKVHYPDYLATSAAALVANATRDLGEFLARLRLDHPEAVPQAARLPSRAGWLNQRRDALAHAAKPARPLRIGYHLPCHLKAQEIGNPSLELLREVPGVEVIDLSAGCCGMAGTFGMKSDTYDLSRRVGAPLFERVEMVAPDLLTTECSTCRMQLNHATGVEAVHPVTLLALAYGL